MLIINVDDHGGGVVDLVMEPRNDLLTEDTLTT